MKKKKKERKKRSPNKSSQKILSLYKFNSDSEFSDFDERSQPHEGTSSRVPKTRSVKRNTRDSRFYSFL